MRKGKFDHDNMHESLKFDKIILGKT
jgi:hypothetical protein